MQESLPSQPSEKIFRDVTTATSQPTVWSNKMLYMITNSIICTTYQLLDCEYVHCKLTAPYVPEEVQIQHADRLPVAAKSS
jgi:hypothetical protein